MNLKQAVHVVEQALDEGNPDEIAMAARALVESAKRAIRVIEALATVEWEEKR